MLLDKVQVTAADDLAVGLFAVAEGTVLRVPHGMAGLPVQTAFRLLYMAFVAFRRTRPDAAMLHPLDGVSPHAGGTAAGPGTASFIDCLAFDELFDRANPLHLLALRPRLMLREHGRLQQFDRHLHRALFDEADAPYFPRLPTARKIRRQDGGDIAGLYFFLAEDFYLNLLQIDPGIVWGSYAREATACATDFRHRHLREGDSLYGADADQCLQLRVRLQQLLRRAYRDTTLRSKEFLALHAALDRYLHPSLAHGRYPGQIWGMKNFWPIWESMCLHECLRQATTTGDMSIVACDATHLPAHPVHAAQHAAWDRQQRAIFAHNGICRRPDLLLQRSDGFTVVDFKYYASVPPWHQRSRPEQPGGKHQQDLDNIELYGLLLHRHLAAAGVPAPAIGLEFWLPGTEAARQDVASSPAWDPPLTVVTLPMQEMIARYGELYAPGLRTAAAHAATTTA